MVKPIFLANVPRNVRKFAPRSLKCGQYLKKNFERCGCWRIACLVSASATCESQLSHLSDTNTKRTASRATPFKEKKTSILEVGKRAKPRKDHPDLNTMVPSLGPDGFSAEGFFLPLKRTFSLMKRRPSEMALRDVGSRLGRLAFTAGWQQLAAPGAAAPPFHKFFFSIHCRISSSKRNYFFR